MVMTDFLVGEERVIIFLSATLVSILSRNLLSLFAEVIQNLITSSPLPYHSLLMCGFQLQSPNRSCVFLVIPPSHMVCSQQSKNDAFITQVRLLFLCSKSCSISHFTERRGPYASLKGLGHQLLSSSFLLPSIRFPSTECGGSGKPFQLHRRDKLCRGSCYSECCLVVQQYWHHLACLKMQAQTL